MSSLPKKPNALYLMLAIQELSEVPAVVFVLDQHEQS